MDDFFGDSNLLLQCKVAERNLDLMNIRIQHYDDVCLAESISMRQNRACKGGFTLTELLVVIVIMGVLAGLLFPVGRRVLESSRSAKCIANLRQLGAAANQWTLDNNGWMLPTLPSGQNLDGISNQGWVTALFPYVSPGVNLWKTTDYNKRPADVFACPSSKSPVTGSKLLVTASWCSDYAKNGVVNRDIPASAAIYPSFKVGGMNNMSKVIFFADSSFGRDVSPFQTTNGNRGNIANLHDGKANVLFYDGHVEALDASNPAQLPLGGTAYNRPPWQP